MGALSPNADFRDKLAVAEGSADKPNFGYGEARYGPQDQFALGRYQMTRDALRAAGIIDAHSNWTGKYGIRSAREFLADPEAQEMALTDYLKDVERQLRANGSFDYVGRRIDGRVASFTVTRGGLIGAAHREGARHTRDYLGTVEPYGFATRGHELRPEYLPVETRLRTFAGARYE